MIYQNGNKMKNYTAMIFANGTTSVIELTATNLKAAKIQAENHGQVLGVVLTKGTASKLF